MKKSYDNSQNFIDDLHNESLRDLTIEMGYLTEEDFKGSKVSCVFHGDDATPSLQVTDNFFRCYSCGAKGDIIKWVQLSDNLNFIEALNLIADNLNVEFKTKSFAKYNSVKFRIEKEWKTYLDEMSTLMSKDGDLTKHVKGMVAEYFPFEVGYDTRSNFIVLPFTSKTGNILGFTKRRVDYPEERKMAKWIHSSIKDSLIEHCSNIFNLEESHIEVSKTGHVYLVEGPKDVAAVKRQSINNVIAICGTSNFNEKILSILGVIRNIDMCFDGDDAGRKAMMRNIVMISKIDPVLAMNTRILLLPDGEDPASVESSVLKDVLSKPIDGIEWLVNSGEDDEIVDLVKESSSILIEDKVVHLLNLKLGFHSSQSREWLNYRIKKPVKKEEEQISGMQNRLLATIGELDNIDVEPLNMSEEEARKMLKLRYNYK